MATHPKPAPVRLSPKVTEGILIEACLDVDWEGMHEDRPAELLATFDRVSHEVAYIRLLMSGELDVAWAVLKCQKQLWQERERIAEKIGDEVRRADRNKPAKKEAAKEIKRLVKQGRRLDAAAADCRRFWKEHVEYDKDREAAARLGLGGGGEG